MINERPLLQNAEWLFAFDFDSTLVNPQLGNSIGSEFFRTIESLEGKAKLTWGVCTGRSLVHILEGLEHPTCLTKPHYLITQERDIFYLQDDGEYCPDYAYNEKARSDLYGELGQNKELISLIKGYVATQTNGQWVSLEDDPAGVIAESEAQISVIVGMIEEFNKKTSNLDYQRNSVYLRLSHKSYSKGAALQYLQRNYKLDVSKTVAVGDNLNDLSMLNVNISKYFGVPSNAHKDLIQIIEERNGRVSSLSYAEGVSDILKTIPFG